MAAACLVILVSHLLSRKLRGEGSIRVQKEIRRATCEIEIRIILGDFPQQEYIVLGPGAIAGLAENLQQPGAKFRSEMIQVSRSIEGATQARSKRESVRIFERQFHR